MKANRMFDYYRGNEYHCEIVVNPYIGNVVFTKINVPENTPKEIKQEFLDEAEQAVLLKIDEELNYYGGQ